MSSSSSSSSSPTPEFLSTFLDSVRETKEKVHENTNKVSKSMDESLHSISFQIGKTIDICRESSTEMKIEAELKAKEIAEEMKKKEDLFFKSFTQKIKEVIESHPTASAIASGSVVLLALPPTRRLLWRSTIGRFETEEQAFAKLTRRAQILKDGAASTDGALRGFSEETQLAIAEMNSGVAKLKALGSSLRRAEKGAEKSLAGVEEVLGELRTSPNKDAVALRSELGVVQATLEKQRRDALRELKRIYKQGIEI